VESGVESGVEVGGFVLTEAFGIVKNRAEKANGIDIASITFLCREESLNYSTPKHKQYQMYIYKVF